MAWIQRFGKLVVLLYLVSVIELVSSNEDDFFDCESTIRIWAESSTDNGIKEDRLTLKDLLFFLHVPRTGGRTYYHCFLRKLYTGSQECPRSYDKLRFDPRKQNCRLMVTHDDYSFMSKLPKERTSVVTVLRNPVDRIFSTYEFSIEVGARFLVHPNLTSVTKFSRRIRSQSRSVSTLDIWPWKYLVPWMREDLFTRREARKIREGQGIEEINNSYNIEDMAMPLHVFINEPIAHDIIHNGATFQVAGLTNNSYLDESHKIRHCVRNHPELGRYVLEVAKNRLDHMLYVGLTEDHKNSATMFTNMVGEQVLSQSEAFSSSVEQKASNKSEPSFPFPDSESDGSNQYNNSKADAQTGEVPSTDVETKNKYRTPGELMQDYEKCITSLRNSQDTRRTTSLKKIAPVFFSKEARLRVPEAVIKQIQLLNSLDVDLYEHARGIFLQQQKHLVQNEQGRVVKQQHNDIPSEADEIMRDYSLYGLFGWRVVILSVFLSVSVLLIVLVFLVVTARRTSKLKV